MIIAVWPYEQDIFKKIFEDRNPAYFQGHEQQVGACVRNYFEESLKFTDQGKTFSQICEQKFVACFNWHCRICVVNIWSIPQYRSTREFFWNTVLNMSTPLDIQMLDSIGSLGTYDGLAPGPEIPESIKRAADLTYLSVRVFASQSKPGGKVE